METGVNEKGRMEIRRDGFLMMVVGGDGGGAGG